MLQITPMHRIFIAIDAIDFRAGIDGLAALCRQKIRADPTSGHVFVFRNRRNTAVKILLYDSQGYWLCHKRLSSGAFKHWPNSEQVSIEFSVAKLQVLLFNGDPLQVNCELPFKPIN